VNRIAVAAPVDPRRSGPPNWVCVGLGVELGRARRCREAHSPCRRTCLPVDPVLRSRVPVPRPDPTPVRTTQTRLDRPPLRHRAERAGTVTDTSRADRPDQLLQVPVVRTTCGHVYTAPRPPVPATGRQLHVLRPAGGDDSSRGGFPLPELLRSISSRARANAPPARRAAPAGTRARTTEAGGCRPLRGMNQKLARPLWSGRTPHPPATPTQTNKTPHTTPPTGAAQGRRSAVPWRRSGPPFTTYRGAGRDGSQTPRSPATATSSTTADRGVSVQRLRDVRRRLASAPVRITSAPVVARIAVQATCRRSTDCLRVHGQSGVPAVSITSPAAARHFKAAPTFTFTLDADAGRHHLSGDRSRGFVRPSHSSACTTQYRLALPVRRRRIPLTRRPVHSRTRRQLRSDAPSAAS
jgi:hypothetical protein